MGERRWIATVSELESAGVLQVEDGNHGEYRPRPNEFTTDGTPYIRAANMSSGVVDFAGAERINHTALTRIRKGIGAEADTLLSHKGTVGKVAFVPTNSPDFVCSPQTTFWRSLDPQLLDPIFLNILLRSPVFQAQLDVLKSSTDMAPYVSLTQQRSLVLELPGPPEQRAIAEVLGSFDGKIAASLHQEALADQLICACHAYTLATFDSHQTPLLEAFDFCFGEPFSGEQFAEPGNGRPLIRVRDLKTYRPQVWTTERRTRETVIQPGDVVVGMDAEFRPTAWLGPPGVMNQRVCRVSSENAGPAFVREALRKPLAEIEGYKSATTVIHLNKTDLERHVVAVPEPAAMRSFEESAAPIYARRVSTAAERRTLAATRDALLPALMSGKLRVRDAEQIASDLT